MQCIIRGICFYCRTGSDLAEEGILINFVGVEEVLILGNDAVINRNCEI